LRYTRKIALGLILVVCITMLGCTSDKNGTVAGTNYYYPEKEQEKETQVTETESLAIKAELKPEHYMIIENDMTTQHMILKQMESGKSYIYYYSTLTKLRLSYLRIEAALIEKDMELITSQTQLMQRFNL